MKYLFVCAIGPVQDFIATARRSRDLWYGSWMLSELSKAAARAIDNSPASKLIFPLPANPNLLDPESKFSSPNKIVATVEHPEAVAEAVKDAIDTRLEKLRDEALDRIKSNLFNKHKPLAVKQIEDLPELYWVSVPYRENGYVATREEAEALLAARKATRDFKQAIGDYVPKSSLDGARESVIDEKEYPQNDESDQEKEDKIRFLYEHYRARQGERLSGVDLLKRLGGEKQEPDFKSTSHMAAIPFMEKLGTDRKNKLISDIRTSFAIATWGVSSKDEGSLLFENRILELMPSGNKQTESIKSLIEKIKKVTGNDSSPSPYYALLAADGDNMGKVIDNQDSEETHRKLSAKLSEFAAQVPTIVEKYDGLMIYSGGDDVLAYLPINRVLKCAAELEQAFREGLDKFPAKDGKTSTLSLGIVVAHHLDPLSDVLQLAREAEHKAKDERRVPGKNGLAITLSKRSGVDRTIVGKFTELYQRIDEVIRLTNGKIISSGTAYELQELQRTLPDNFPLKGLRAEAIRIVKHKQAAGGDKLSEEKKKDYMKIVERWLANLSPNQNPKGYTLHDLANELIIAKALANEPEID